MTTQEPIEPTTQPGTLRPLLLIGAGVLALLIISVVVVLVLGRGNTPAFSADSPEGTLQRYLAAVEDGDYDAAYAYFSDRVKGDMSVDDFRRSIAMYGGTQSGQRVLFRGSNIDGDRARLELDIEYFYDDGFGGSSFRQPREVNMVREGGEWRIDDALAGLEPAAIDAPF
jgi:hypothetical protein